MSHYAKPPIVEAVIEIQFDGDFPEDDREKIAKIFSVSHPIRGVLQNIYIDSSSSNGIPKPPTLEMAGIRLSSLQQSEVLNLVSKPSLARPTVGQGGGVPQSSSISAAQLAPYCDWESLEAQFKSVWRASRKQLRRRHLSRVGVRFINRIDIPGTISDFKKWISCLPNIPSIKPASWNLLDSLHQLDNPVSPTLGSFASHAILMLGTVSPINWAVQANLAANIVQSPIIGHTGINLDLDIYAGQLQEDIVNKVPSQLTFDNEEMLDGLLKRLRLTKNELFEACITDATRGLFK